MADILPIRPFRYNSALGQNIDILTSPLFDVVSDKQRQKLYQNPLNSIHLSVPRHGAAEASCILKDWKQNGVLLQDHLYGIYVYYQYFRLAGSPGIYCRKGFICHIRVYEWQDRIILRHENTIPEAVNDRIALLDQTELHASPTHGLYTDPEFELEAYMDLAIRDPIYETEDYQGVREVMAVIQDLSIIAKFVEKIAHETIILADGHHRYESSLEHMKKLRMSDPHHTGQEGYNFHLMYLTNTESDDLRILPTHRIIQHMNIAESAVMSKIEQFFHVKPIEDADTLNEIIAGKLWTFGLIFSESAYKITLKSDVFAMLLWPFPEEIKRLDLTIMHYFIIEKVLGIPGKQQRQSTQIAYDRSYSDCMKKVIKGEADMAIITNEVSIEDVKKVCASGFTMPQKSTYFYPKVIGGLLFTSIRASEFDSPLLAPF